MAARGVDVAARPQRRSPSRRGARHLRVAAASIELGTVAGATPSPPMDSLSVTGGYADDSDDLDSSAEDDGAVSFSVSLSGDVMSGSAPTTSDLHTACAEGLNGHVDAIRRLLDGGIDVNSTDGLNRTPLWLACENGNLEAAALLLDRRADLNRVCQTGTPLWIACKRGYVDVATLLLDRGAKVDRPTPSKGTSPLYFRPRGISSRGRPPRSRRGYFLRRPASAPLGTSPASTPKSTRRAFASTGAPTRIDRTNTGPRRSSSRSARTRSTW